MNTTSVKKKHSVLVAVRTDTNTECLYKKFYLYNCPPEDEHIVARNM